MKESFQFLRSPLILPMCALIAIVAGFGCEPHSGDKSEQNTAPETHGATAAELPPKRIAAQRAREEVRKKIEQTLDELREEGYGLYVQFRPTGSGQLTAILSAAARRETDANWTRKLTLDSGQGIPLWEVDYLWTVERPAAAAPLVTEEADAGRHHVQTLRLSTESKRASLGFDNQSEVVHVWSPDGKWMLVVNDDGHLQKINTQTWEIEQVVRYQRGQPAIRDLCWSSEGLIVLQQMHTLNYDPAFRTRWVTIDPKPSERERLAGNRLLVLDPESLQVRRAFRLSAGRVDGHPRSELVYVEETPGTSELLVVNVKTGELLNAVEAESVRQKKTRMLRGAGPRGRPDGTRPVSLGRLWIVDDGRKIISVRDGSGGCTLHRLSTADGHLVCEESLFNLPKKGGAVVVSSGGEFVCIPFRLSRSTCFLLDSNEFDTTVGNVHCPESLTRVAVDSSTKTIFALGSKAYVPQLRVVQGDDHTDIALERDRYHEVSCHPHGRGALVFGALAAYWIEIAGGAEEWPFARSWAKRLPIQPCETKSVVPAEPIVPKEQKEEAGHNVARIALYPDWLGWSPDGDAFYVLKNRDHSFHRFDATTLRETHRLEIPKSNVLGPWAYLTADGILFDNQGARHVYLLRFEDLNPIWELDQHYLYRPAGNAAHGLIAGMQSGGIVVVEAKSGEVRARASELDVVGEWPDYSYNPLRAVGVTSDPSRFLCFRYRLAALQLQQGKLNGIEMIGRNTTLRTPTPLIDPEDRGYSIGQQTAYGPKALTYTIDARAWLRVTDAQNHLLASARLRRNRGFVAPHPKDANRVLVGVGGETELLTFKIDVE